MSAPIAGFWVDAERLKLDQRSVARRRWRRVREDGTVDRVLALTAPHTLDHRHRTAGRMEVRGWTCRTQRREASRCRCGGVDLIPKRKGEPC